MKSVAAVDIFASHNAAAALYQVRTEFICPVRIPGSHDRSPLSPDLPPDGRSVFRATAVSAHRHRADLEFLPTMRNEVAQHRVHGAKYSRHE